MDPFTNAFLQAKCRAQRITQLTEILKRDEVATSEEAWEIASKIIDHELEKEELSCMYRNEVN